MSLEDRIEINPEILVGKPVIRGTRLSVQHILNLLINNMSVEEILEEYEHLERADILACIEFAAQNLEETFFLPIAKAA